MSDLAHNRLYGLVSMWMSKSPISRFNVRRFILCCTPSDPNPSSFSCSSECDGSCTSCLRLAKPVDPVGFGSFPAPIPVERNRCSKRIPWTPAWPSSRIGRARRSTYESSRASNPITPTPSRWPAGRYRTVRIGSTAWRRPNTQASNAAPRSTGSLLKTLQAQPHANTLTSPRQR